MWQPVVASARGGIVDAHGDNLIKAATTGNMEAVFRHNPLVDFLAVAAREAGCFSRAEDASFYHAAIPAANLASMAAHAGTARHVRPLVPDLTVVLDPAKGMQLVEAKAISFCPSWYGTGGGGVGKRER